MKGTPKILRAVAEGSVVKRGDLLIELDASGLSEESIKQEIATAEARRDLQQAGKPLLALKLGMTGEAEIDTSTPKNR